MTSKDTNKDSIEGSCREILLKIANTNPNFEGIFNLIVIILFFIISFVFAYFFLAFKLPYSFILKILELLTTVYSIIIGFALTSLSIFLAIFDKEFIEFLSSAKSDLYKNESLYKATVLVFFQYLFALLLSLAYILICYFLSPFYMVFESIKTELTYVFFIILFAFLCWTFLSIKAMIANIYTLVIFKSIYYKLKK